ncbi:MAG TPA: 50S ribosomal protein L19e [Halobacteria archaeon]|jgi:large subunit ribosomal protein L19e|nr:50S ribosomal protein L19e [Halobacteria archaeon]
MTNLLKQKKLAAKVMDVGVGRVYLDPEHSEDISAAITREDIRNLIKEGAIKKTPKKGISRARARERDLKRKYGHRKGHGRRKGGQNARYPRKSYWIKNIRAQRRYLRKLKDDGSIERSTYRLLYRKSKGGEFKNVNSLNSYIENKKLITKNKEGV